MAYAAKEGGEFSRDRVLALVVAIGFHTLLLGSLLQSSYEPDRTSLAPSRDLRAEIVIVNDAQPNPISVSARIKSASDPEPFQSQPLEVPSTVPEMSVQEQKSIQMPTRDARAAPESSPLSATNEKPPLSPQALEETELLARYRAALVTAATAAWDPSNVPAGVHCTIAFTQIPGGEVISMQYLDCPFNVAARESVERAIRAGVMPYAGYESVFGRQQTIDFCYPANACGNRSPDAFGEHASIAPL
jgi:hypothetical protein